MGFVWEESLALLSVFMATFPKAYVEPFLCLDQWVLVQMLTYLKLATEIKTQSVFEWDLY